MSSAATPAAAPAATPAAAPAPETPNTGINGGIRFAISISISIILGLFMLLWDGGYINVYHLPHWLGGFVILPLIAVVLAYGGDSLVQQLSCKQVQWLIQLQRVAPVPIPFILMWGILYMFPILRWPIEGLAQNASPSVRHGLSSGFYSFWIGLYTQSFLVGISQMCPK